jgi:hypothetical protein
MDSGCNFRFAVTDRSRKREKAPPGQRAVCVFLKWRGFRVRLTCERSRQFPRQARDGSRLPGSLRLPIASQSTRGRRVKEVWGSF